MKKILMAGAAMLSLAVVGGSSVQAATDSLTIDAVVVAPITVTCNTSLNFGFIDTSAGAGTITVDTTGARSGGAPGALVSGGAESEGVCDLTGEPSLDFQVTIPATSITNGTDTMPVNNFRIDSVAGTPGPSPYDGTFSGAGDETLSIGGDLVVAGGESAGNYTGTVTVTVLYN